MKERLAKTIWFLTLVQNAKTESDYGDIYRLSLWAAQNAQAECEREEREAARLNAPKA